MLSATVCPRCGQSCANGRLAIKEQLYSGQICMKIYDCRLGQGIVSVSVCNTVRAGALGIHLWVSKAMRMIEKYKDGDLHMHIKNPHAHFCKITA